MKQLIIVLILSTMATLGAPSAIAAPETILLYSYHNHPPFVTGEKQGLTYRLAAQLNTQQPERYRFEVRIVPRSRLNLIIGDWIAGRCPATDCRSDWMIPWVNPQWGFIRGERDNYLWQPLLEDANVIISSTRAALDYQNPKSLSGKTLAGIRGHKYVGIDPLVEAGLIRRIDGNHERDNLLTLLQGRVDVTLLPRSTIRYLLQEEDLFRSHAADLYIASTPHQSYTRYAMMPAGREDLQQLLTPIDLTQLSER